MRITFRPCLASASRSPMAWAFLKMPKVYGLPGNGDVGRVMAGQLDEKTRVRTTLVQLSRGVEEAGPIPDGGGESQGIPETEPDCLQELVRGRLFRQIGQERNVIAGMAL